MPKGNQIPGLPINEEAARQFLCAHVFDTLDTATRSMDIETAGALAEALVHEIEHSLAIVEREKRWKTLIQLLTKQNPTATDLERIRLLRIRQGVTL